MSRLLFNLDILSEESKERPLVQENNNFRLFRTAATNYLFQFLYSDFDNNETVLFNEVLDFLAMRCVPFLVDGYPSWLDDFLSEKNREEVVGELLFVLAAPETQEKLSFGCFSEFLVDVAQAFEKVVLAGFNKWVGGSDKVHAWDIRFTFSVLE